MEYRQLGRSGLTVPVLSFGTATFGGTNEFFQRWGQTDVAEATRMVDLCLDSGVNFFDTADIYSQGASEEVLGQALKGKRERALISTKTTFRFNDDLNQVGSSRHHIVRACEASLKRLGTDHIDVYFMHGFDALTPVEETLRALDDLTRAGKIGYIGASNFSGWQLMKALATSERYGLNRYVAYQGYYSLIGRHYEWELMPLGIDQGVGLMVWSPLGWGRLTGKIRRGQENRSGRIAAGGAEGGPPVSDEYLFGVVDALDAVAEETGKSVAQVALNWLLTRPTVCNIVVGARTEEQLKQNLAAVGWALSPEQVARLDAASQETPIYPYWHQKGFDERNPKPTTW
ncbi:aldo/keto reductase [Methylobacterium gregans]|uniref:1-deoxyxylulose-5-phosphate synthase YajO n=1 Tax=Methylobacterium gregans TaxID=374424 RepID=A0AA37HU61_9HYPH|nr:aldo/keto reductase [Methylobacterium gregans]MDQ0524002.1 aryl-alcohol dehydrogenase-like predicted oxidoreductase [Methylobacterium gregans]GJD81714.1 1-deoxyxylulose-5-phosphate synthase YajO [Methylobacterium gregans]GLS56914.1 oxidoreductase [Methylobacterium gregans]